MRGAGLIVAAQGATGVVVAAVLLLRGLGGADQRVVNGFGTALWFALMGGAVLSAGCALLFGRRWGRGLAVFAELLLLPVAWYLAVGSHRPARRNPGRHHGADRAGVAVESRRGAGLGLRARSAWTGQLR